MSVLTYEAAPTATAEAAVKVPASTQAKGFWSRMFDRIAEARMRQAEEYIARHSHLLHQFERGREPR